MELHTKRLLLREYKRSDAAAVTRELNPIEMAHYTTHIPHPYRLKHAQDFIDGAIKHQTETPRTAYNLAIILGDELIGDISLMKVNRWTKSAEIGYWVSKRHQGQGYATEATQRMVDYAIKTLRMHRIDLHAAVQNKPSNDIARKLGFTLEGTKKDGARPKSTGKFIDMNMYALVR